jgi:hypothetical protein
MSVLGSIVLMMSMSSLLQSTLDSERANLRIIDTGTAAATVLTNIDGGPAVGDMLNAHFFPGVKDFNQGRYTFAVLQFDYVLNRPHYLAANPKQAEYLSTAYYLRGMIYRYHADGLGRYSLAKEDFEAAIKTNENNYVAHLELARLYAVLGLTEPSISILRSLEKRALEPDVATAVAEELKTLTATPAVAATPSVAAAKGSSTADVAPAGKPTIPPVASGRARNGTVAVNSRLAVEVYVAGKHVGSTPLVLQLPEGTHTVEYRHADLTKSVTHAVKAGEQIAETVSFDITVDINANPWAEVIIEGSAAVLGETPLAGVRVPFGASLVFRNPAFPEKRYQILKADRSISVSFR